MKKDLIFLVKAARWAGQNSKGYLQPSQCSPAVRICQGEDWVVLSSFRSFQALVECSALIFPVFFCVFPETTCFTMELYSEHHVLMRSHLDSASIAVWDKIIKCFGLRKMHCSQRLSKIWNNRYAISGKLDYDTFGQSKFLTFLTTEGIQHPSWNGLWSVLMTKNISLPKHRITAHHIAET